MAERRRDGEENGDRKLVSEKKHDVKNDKSWPSGIKSQSRGAKKGKGVLLCSSVFL